EISCRCRLDQLAGQVRDRPEVRGRTAEDEEAVRIKERLVIVEQVATDLVVANFVCQPVPEGKTEPVAREDDDRGLLPAQLADEVLLYRLRDRHADVVVARRGIEPQQVPEEARVVREVEDAFAAEDVR